MKSRSLIFALISGLSIFVGGLSFVGAANAQDSLSILSGPNSAASFSLGPSAFLGDIEPSISVGRAVEEKSFQNNMVQEALNFNLGLQLAPFEGLSIRADAWRQQVEDSPAASSSDAKQWSSQPQFYIQDSIINEFGLENPLIGSNLDSNGFDIGASYVWETSRFGQFTLSSTTTYVDKFENSGSLLELVESDLQAVNGRIVSPELQSSLMLSWEFGNHRAKAITNYFDSFKDISELDISEINELLDNITTVDFQYGYSVNTGDNDRAIISFGIRNIFNEESAQILNATTRILDQNGRVAYGSIKYQF
ncbi:MAG: hypothetical protein ACI945_000182 [Pseudohongiellaceae bacterium]|jgi:hypothetical protein